ncbi:AidA/PixA family protein [Sorangium sp. So ce1000]|uniref:AidA/PixA family protein n=1 Tax=Sorangium sp. So ce1000 TaxID=3133325 RepID=UPI003F5ED839
MSNHSDDINKDATETVDLTIVVDTISLSSEPSSTPDNPAGCDHRYAFMITDAKHAVGGNGTADLNLQAATGDTLRIWASSISHQVEEEVFIYDFVHWDPEGQTSTVGVLSTDGMRYRSFPKIVNVPQDGQDDHEPPKVSAKSIDVNCAEIDVNNYGTEWFMVRFVVYGPLPDGEGARPVKGYYQWDPSITVNH